MNQLTIDTMDQDISRQTFSQMVQRYGSDRVSICNFEHARIWDGTPQSFTAYA